MMAADDAVRAPAVGDVTGYVTQCRRAGQQPEQAR